MFGAFPSGESCIQHQETLVEGRGSHLCYVDCVTMFAKSELGTHFITSRSLPFYSLVQLPHGAWPVLLSRHACSSRARVTDYWNI